MVIPQLSTRASLVCALLLGLAAPLSGAPEPACTLRSVTSAVRWEAPLNRQVTVRAGQIKLANALDRVATAAGVRISYSAELLPLGRDVCASYKGVVGDVIADLLKGVLVHAVVAGQDHIVLAPNATQVAADDQMPGQDAVFPLQAVVVTATGYEYPAQQPAYAVTRIDRKQLSSETSVTAAINANVPGMWAWQSPIGFTTQYSSRGATSFGASSPKVYIDGIEVANPLLITQILPENIERVDVIRGPQGGALYGADAIGGVTNIVTRHPTSNDGAPRVQMRSGLALSASSFIPNAGVGQDHTLSVRLGSQARSTALNLAIGSIGEYMPGSFSRHVSADGSARVIGERTLLSATARFFSQSAGNPASLLTDSLYGSNTLGMQQYTLGANVKFRQNDRITHALVLGMDGYALNGVPQDSVGSLSVADSVLRAAGDGALRTTVRLSSALDVASGPLTTALITLSAEHSNLHQYGELWTAAPYGAMTQGRSVQTSMLSSFDESRSSRALAAQVDAALLDRFSVTGGLRVERDEVNNVAATNTLPMLAASYLLGTGDVSVRLRTAYGKAIRWPSLQTHLNLAGMGARAARPLLAPEQQSGLEAGLDIALKGVAGIQLTRYDQTASGLLQSVAVPGTGNGNGTGTGTGTGTGMMGARYVVQRVGEIGNDGWEMQAYLHRGRLSLTTSFAVTESRVVKTADGYTGDLRVGDRMLAVPARTLGAQAAWSAHTWATSVSAARAFDWINYDRIALLQAAQEPTGEQLRAYWQPYNGFTHVRVNVSKTLGRNLTLLLTGDNLLGEQTGEPDNLTVLPGRTISFAVKAAF